MSNKKSKVMSNYPAGAEHDPNAPYNEPSAQEYDFDVEVTATLSCSTTVTSYDAYKIVEEEEDGCYSWIEKENCDFKEDFKRDMYTPTELIRYLKDLVEKDLKKHPNTSWDVRKQVLESCNMWLAGEEYLEVEEA